MRVLARPSPDEERREDKDEKEEQGGHRAGPLPLVTKQRRYAMREDTFCSEYPIHLTLPRLASLFFT